MFPLPLPPPPPPCLLRGLYRILIIINNNNNLNFLQNEAEINYNASKQIKSFRNLNAVFQYLILKQRANLFRRVKFFFTMAPLRAAQKLRKICNVLRLINAKRTFARTYKGTCKRSGLLYKEILDEIVLLLGQLKCFHLSETESIKEHFISFSDFPCFFKQKSTAMHYLTLFQEL